MKLFTGWVLSTGLILTTAAAHAQVLGSYEIGRSPYAAVSDIQGPYAAMPPDVPVPRYGYGYGPRLLPPQEVYTVLRDRGFSPLGAPPQHGLVYTIAVIDRAGDDGRLVIDARTGRILRFMPADRMGGNFDEDQAVTYGPAGPLPMYPVRGGPRPPAAIPHVASRTPPVPLPKASPRSGDALAPAAAPPQQSAAIQVKPAEPQTAPPPAAPAVVAAKPAAPQILPTQEMPKMQGLD